MRGLFLAAGLLAAAASPAGAIAYVPTTNILANGSFDSGSFSAVTSTGYRSVGESAASGWLIWNNSQTTTVTQLFGSADPLPGGGGAMLSLSTGDSYSGVYQFTSAFRFASVDIRLLGGGAYVGIARDGGTITVTDTVVSGDGWQHIVLDAGEGNYADELVIYGMGGSSAFLADNAYAGAVAQPVPEPGEWAMFGCGLGVAAMAARRRRRA